MNIRNFEVIVDNLENNPHCLHGPTLIFRKNTTRGSDYYACSACRDNKFCNFHHSVNEKKKVLLKSSNFWKGQQEEIVSSINKSKPYKKYIKIFGAQKNNLSATERKNSRDIEKVSALQAGYCYTCNCLFEDSECGKHDNCNILSNLTHYQLTHPTLVVIPKTDTKTHAQYFFSESTVKDVSLILSRLNISKALCVGCPRIHEYLLNNCENKIRSLLLDFDKNYFNFYDKHEFIWYNMFNNYVFDETQKEVLLKFLSSGEVVVLLDPPFGGRVEPLARTLTKLNETFLEMNKKASQKVNCAVPTQSTKIPENAEAEVDCAEQMECF